ncbi:MAG: hypothetical protein ACI4EA_09440 [Candidatus Ornithomonoglobus sp.]
MKKNFTVPEINIAVFSADDIVTTSEVVGTAAYNVQQALSQRQSELQIEKVEDVLKF